MALPIPPSVCLDCEKLTPPCPQDACTTSQCPLGASGPVCNVGPVCPSVNDMAVVCVNSTPTVCIYTPTIDCSVKNTPGNNYIFVLGIGCTLGPAVDCVPTIPGCTQSQPVFVNGSTSCVETLLCNRTTCPPQTCSYTTTPDVMGQCLLDQTPCPGSDMCFTCPAGTCTLEPVQCNSTTPCSQGMCSSSQGCFFNPKNCDDGNACTTDSCDSHTGNCIHLPACNDNNMCTTDSCDLSTHQCEFVNRSCSDNNQCTTDLCNPTTGCYYLNISCYDNNNCTSDSCDPFLGCINTPLVCSTLGSQGCDVFWCNSKWKGGQCVNTQLECVDSIMTPAAVAATSALAAAVVAGIVIAAVVFVTASGGVAVFVSSYAGSGASSILSVHENPHYTSQFTHGRENPLNSDLFLS